MTSSGPANGLPGGYPSGEYDPAFSVNLGPEGSMSAPTDQDLAMQAAIQFLGEKRYPEHNQRMLEILDKFGLSTPGMEMAVAAHDMVDHGLINPKNQATKQRAQETIYDLWEQVRDKKQLFYALGCAISAGYIEDEVGETWRYAGLDAYADRPAEEREQLRAAIEKDDSVAIDEKVLKSAGSYELDTSSLRHAATTRDVEGFIIKGVELLDNLDHPPPGNPTSVWRDCIEIFNCYSPALTLFKFKRLAGELRGKGLEFYHEDTEEFSMAADQHRTSSRHFSQIKAIFDRGLEEALELMEEEGYSGGGYGPEGEMRRGDLEEIGRIKTIGSETKKLLSDRYQEAGVQLVPDGIGFRVVVPDSAGGMGAIRLGNTVKQVIESGQFTDAMGQEISIQVKHPHPEEPAEEDLISNPRGSGYKSYHVVFMCRIGEDTVPFEIQTVTQEQEWLHTWDKASEVLRKAESEPLEDKLDDIGHIGRRADHLQNKPLNRELIPYTWMDMVELLPALGSPVDNNYELIHSGVARLMVPPELADFMAQELDGRDINDDVFLPPQELSVDDFKWMIGQLDPSLETNEQIEEAIEFLSQQDLPPRKDGAGKLEGHLLPVAFHAGVMTVLSSKHWEKEDPSQYLSDTITAALLHDMIEDVDQERREEMKVEIRSRFGDEVADIVETMTAPEIEDRHERRSTFANQLDKNPEALAIKVSDNIQNHVADLAYLAGSHPSPENLKEIKDYFIKTMVYFSSLFNSEKLPEEYRQAHLVVSKLGKKLFPEVFQEN